MAKKASAGDGVKMQSQKFDTLMEFADEQRPGPFRTRGGPTAARAETILVQNNSGADRDQFDVLGIDGVIFTPTENPNTIQGRIALKGVTPDVDDHAGKFVILAEPLRAGKVGQAYIHGACWAKLNVADADDQSAIVADGEPGYLNTMPAGGTMILWKESGTGFLWGLVLLAEQVIDWMGVITAVQAEQKTCTVARIGGDPAGVYYETEQEEPEGKYWPIAGTETTGIWLPGPFDAVGVVCMVRISRCAARPVYADWWSVQKWNSTGIPQP